MSHYFLPVLLLAVGASANLGHADEPATKSGRLMYVVQNRPAKAVATALGKHFKGEAEVQVVTDGPSNCLLIRGDEKAIAEVVKLLATLDRKPAMVAVEIYLAERPVPKKGEKKEESAKDADEKAFTGKAREVLGKLTDLSRKGELGPVRRIQLTATEGQPASVTVGETRAVVDSITVRRAGAPTTISYRDTGFLAKVTATVAEDKVIVLDLSVQEARLHTPDDGVVLGKDEKGREVRATEILRATLQGKVRVPAGEAVVAKDARAGVGQPLVVVVARVVDPAREEK